MAKGKTDYSKPAKVKNAKAAIQVAELPFVVTKGKHPKVYKAVLKVGNASTMIPFTALSRTLLAIYINGLCLAVHDKGLHRRCKWRDWRSSRDFHRNHPREARCGYQKHRSGSKERAGVAWGIDPEELQKIKVTFNKCKPPLTSNDHGWFSTWISWEIQLGLPEIKKNQSSHSRL